MTDLSSFLKENSSDTLEIIFINDQLECKVNEISYKCDLSISNIDKLINCLNTNLNTLVLQFVTEKHSEYIDNNFKIPSTIKTIIFGAINLDQSYKFINNYTGEVCIFHYDPILENFIKSLENTTSFKVYNTIEDEQHIEHLLSSLPNSVNRVMLNTFIESPRKLLELANIFTGEYIKHPYVDTVTFTRNTILVKSAIKY
jgi:hypothetical protein